LIETLRIEGMAIVERVELEFGPGLNVLTGETGAGKSIVLGALALLAGARASAQTIRDGHEEAVVEAVFDTSRSPDLEQALADRGIETEDHQLVVRRSVSKTGRGRARVAGQLVPIATLGELFAGQLEISSQHDSQGLLRPELHGRLLDRMGGLEERRVAVARGYAAVRSLDAELAKLRSETRERARRRDFLAFQVDEIDAARLDPAEVAELRTRRSLLAHAARLQEEGARVLAALTGDPQAAEDAPAVDLLAGAVRRLEGAVSLDPSFGDFATRLRGAQDELRDVALELERHLSNLDDDPASLAVAEERLHQVEQLQRKYGQTVEDVLRFRDTSAAELAALEGADEREALLVGQRERLLASLGDEAKRLSAGRMKAAGRLAKSVQSSLRELAMNDAQFAVALEPAEAPDGMPCGAAGAEIPEFRFSANAGEEPRSLRAVASGGELSRVFLALKQALREADAGMVLVFDEVDAGIGGRAADRVGRKLSELAGQHQVLCITHLPQIAAFAKAQFRVAKGERNGRSHTRIQQVEGTERVEEIARMAGGEAVGEATLEHARELLASRAPA
jgi:DNA repair protein RecN (Recombination protein N)